MGCWGMDMKSWRVKAREWRGDGESRGFRGRGMVVLGKEKEM